MNYTLIAEIKPIQFSNESYWSKSILSYGDEFFLRKYNSNGYLEVWLSYDNACKLWHEWISNSDESIIVYVEDIIVLNNKNIYYNAY